jgi:hypothetical protein
MNAIQSRVTPGFVESPVFGVRPVHRVLTNLCIIFALGFLTVTTFEGAFRYYAARAHVAWLPYVKDVFLIAAVVAGIAKAAIVDLRNLAFYTVLAFAVIGALYGSLLLKDFRQPLFALLTWLPIICGTVTASSIDTQSKAFRLCCLLLWVATVGGIFITTKWHAPWVGFDYEIGGVKMDASREWNIGGIDRVAGFSRSSFDAALECLFLAILTVAGLRYYVLCLPIWLISGAAIYLTTSRSAAAALAVAIGLHILVSFNRASQWLAKFGVVAIAIVLVALPYGAARYYKNKAAESGATSVASTSSFAERATQTWPDAFALQERGGGWVLGRGLGGIGVAQKYFEPQIYNPGDNFFVYLWVAFGAFGMLFLGFLLFQTLRTYVPLDKNRKAGIVIIGSFMAVGLTLNGIESSTPSLFLGMALAWLSQRSASENFLGY